MDTFPARSSTGMVLIPIAISYEIIWALERSPPRSAYLLFEDQPAMTMPYTPTDEMARMNRKPTGIGANTISMTPHREPHGAANGITAHVMNAGTNESTGARMNSGRFAAAGYVSSFTKFFSPSAIGCSHPLPTRLGPCRSCIHAETFRSARGNSATPTM